ncbi:MAG: Uma2 family endonuclease [Saprospiraceae bacterium]|nr:Uma2 family endonuclease [Saprospiraceae bacterium]
MYNNDTAIAINPLAILKPEKQRRRYTLAEYLRREENSSELLEYYDGIITKLPMARGPHNEIIINVGAVLKNTFKADGKPHRVLGGQQKVYMPALNMGVYPDVLVITDTPKYWDDNQVLLINPIVIVEVLSKSTKKNDRTSKFADYKTLESFREYVLIDQNKCSVETYYKEKPNVWQGTDYKDITDSIYLKSIDCSIALADIYENITLK